jgi:hypothetical protein
MIVGAVFKNLPQEAQKYMREKLEYMDCCIKNLSLFWVVFMQVSQVLAQVVQDGKSVLLAQLLEFYSRNGP